MSEQVGADLPEARDGEGQLSKDALWAPAPGDAPVCARRSRVATLAAWVLTVAIGESGTRSQSFRRE
ncbi:MAG: hypothetical protein V3R53_07410, partial [Gammaproteobacteria bacterium]